MILHLLLHWLVFATSIAFGRANTLLPHQDQHLRKRQRRLAPLPVPHPPSRPQRPLTSAHHPSNPAASHTVGSPKPLVEKLHRTNSNDLSRKSSKELPRQSSKDLSRQSSKDLSRQSSQDSSHVPTKPPFVEMSDGSGPMWMTYEEMHGLPPLAKPTEIDGWGEILAQSEFSLSAELDSVVSIDPVVKLNHTALGKYQNPNRKNKQAYEWDLNVPVPLDPKRTGRKVNLPIVDDVLQGMVSMNKNEKLTTIDTLSYIDKRMAVPNDLWPEILLPNKELRDEISAAMKRHDYHNEIGKKFTRDLEQVFSGPSVYRMNDQSVIYQEWTNREGALKNYIDNLPFALGEYDEAKMAKVWAHTLNAIKKDPAYHPVINAATGKFDVTYLSTIPNMTQVEKLTRLAMKKQTKREAAAQLALPKVKPEPKSPSGKILDASSSPKRHPEMIPTILEHNLATTDFQLRETIPQLVQHLSKEHTMYTPMTKNMEYTKDVLEQFIAAKVEGPARANGAAEHPIETFDPELFLKRSLKKRSNKEQKEFNARKEKDEEIVTDLHLHSQLDDLVGLFKQENADLFSVVGVPGKITERLFAKQVDALHEFIDLIPLSLGEKVSPTKVNKVWKDVKAAIDQDLLRLKNMEPDNPFNLFFDRSREKAARNAFLDSASHRPTVIDYFDTYLGKFMMQQNLPVREHNYQVGLQHVMREQGLDALWRFGNEHALRRFNSRFANLNAEDKLNAILAAKHSMNNHPERMPAPDVEWLSELSKHASHEVKQRWDALSGSGGKHSYVDYAEAGLGIVMDRKLIHHRPKPSIPGGYIKYSP